MVHKKQTDNAKGAGTLAAGALAAAVAAGAAYYFIADKHAKKHRKSAAQWASSLQRDLAKEAKKFGTLDDAVIRGIAAHVVNAYGAAEKTVPKVKHAATKAVARGVRGARRAAKGTS